MNPEKIYPWTNDRETVYLKSVVKNPGIPATYPFPIFFEEWGLDVRDITSAWDNKGVPQDEL